jgi:hypothetical protein
MSLLGAALALALYHISPAVHPPQSNEEVDAVLAKWEKAMAGLNKFQIKEATRTTKDVIFGETIIYKGEVKFLAPNRYSWYLNRVEKGEVRPADFIRYVSSGSAVYLFQPTIKHILTIPFPAADEPRLGHGWNLLAERMRQLFPGADSGCIINVPFPLLKVAELKNRYRITLIPSPAGDKSTHVLEFVPRRPEDKQYISKSRLVLSRTTHLPRQFSYQEPSGVEFIWEYAVFLTTDAGVRPEEFAAPKPEPGWTVVEPPTK